MPAITIATACASTGGPGRVTGVTAFSPSAAARVLFVDFVAESVPEEDALRAGESFLGGLVEARQAEVVLARELPLWREEAARRAFEDDRSPATLGARAAEFGADAAITGRIGRLEGGALLYAVDVVDASGRLVDGQGGKVADRAWLDAALHTAGARTLRPIPAPEGPPAAADAARALAARSGLFDRCYALGLRVHPRLVGRGVVAVTLRASPEAADVLVESSSFNDRGMEKCLVGAVRAMRFPVLSGETTLRVPVAYAE